MQIFCSLSVFAHICCSHSVCALIDISNVLFTFCLCPDFQLMQAVLLLIQAVAFLFTFRFISDSSISVHIQFLASSFLPHSFLFTFRALTSFLGTFRAITVFWQAVFSKQFFATFISVHIQGTHIISGHIQGTNKI
jgi:hypothetical protein